MSARIPKLCRHKATGRGYVTDPFTRKEHYFKSPVGSPECQQEYDDWVRRLLDRRQVVASGAPPGSSLTVSQLILDYLAHARVYYRKGGKPTTEITSIESALRPVNHLYGETEANAFGPAALKAVRQWMISAGWARDNINKQVQRIRRVWRWGVEQELIRPDVLEALRAVQGLAKGRTSAPETAPIAAVPPELIESTLPRLHPMVRALVLVQWYSGMRPGEAVIMRPCDVDRSSCPWLYVPHMHKTEHRGLERRIWLGPKARAVLGPLLEYAPSENAWLFPSRARGKHAAQRTHWTVSGYRQAIRVACEEWPDGPKLPSWHPNQLRHRALTDARALAGLEAAQAIGGHQLMETTQIYAEKNQTLAKEVAERLG